MRHATAAIALGVLAACSGQALAQSQATKTPIEHVIVLFQENVSFDHYFGTYPRADNLPGEHRFQAVPETPSVNGLTQALLDHNPNKANPMRLSPKQAMTCDMDHQYTSEQQAYNGGLVNRFIEYASSSEKGCDPRVVMDYFDGNTVTAMWNYAQHFAISDNFFGTNFGPSSPGAINLVSGNTHGTFPSDLTSDNGYVVAVRGTLIDDIDPRFDDCSHPNAGVIAMTGRNIADLLNAKHITWGWFQGGFRPTDTRDGKAVCDAKSVNIGGDTIRDYMPHHDPFQFYEHTANPHHLPPSAADKIGEDDQARHNYDLSDFYQALSENHLPAVSFVKAKAYQDGHAGYSDPIDEQDHLVFAINAVMKSAYWKSAAIIITYDDSDGWYDHVMPVIIGGSAIPGIDALNGPGRCGDSAPGAYSGRCGFGPRLPLLMISPYARVNAVDHAMTDQSSIIRFIEDNWDLGRIGDQSRDALAGPLDGLFDFHRANGQVLILDPKTGDVAP
jgi:phospholipase C